DDVVRAGLEAAEAVPGRFEMIASTRPATVIVDFAHTPDALDKAVSAAREIAGPGRVLVALGAGGDRDRTKRPLMGAAVRDADRVVITNDTPRSEDPELIAAEILAGVVDPGRVTVQLDRAAAIATLLDEAAPGDVVLIA